MSEKNITIRRETEADYRNVENLVRESFWNVYRPGCCEHYVIHCYRSDPAFVPELDYVMELDGELIGQIMYVRSEIECDDGRTVPIMTFGPIGIAPKYKRQGYGKRLLEKPFLFVPIPLAMFPVLYYLFAAIWMGNFPAAILMVIFGTAHMRAAFCSTCRRISSR